MPATIRNLRPNGGFAIRQVLITALLLTLAGCAALRHQPPVVNTVSTGDRVADIVLSLVGTPYRFGGTSPRGFDCSGLVYYAYHQVGVSVPRSAAAQRRATAPVPEPALRPGDLLFFDTSWRNGHVGVYVGNGRFVHAPSSGKRVRVEHLDQGYFSGRLHHAGRLHR